MAAPRSFFFSVCGVFLLFASGSGTSGNRRANQERCGYKVQSAAEQVGKLFVTFKTDSMLKLRCIYKLQEIGPRGLEVPIPEE